MFEEVSDLVQSALDGYKVCLFSYGQTGAGKTHTMQGSRSHQGQGIIPRAISKVGRFWKGCINTAWLEWGLRAALWSMQGWKRRKAAWRCLTPGK